MENNIVGYLTEKGFRAVVLDAAVIPESKDAESIRSALLQTFERAGDLLDLWREKTTVMYPNEPELLQQIPKREGLSVSKFNNTNVMTDTCNTARKLQRLLGEAIKEACQEAGIPDAEIKVFEGNCWHHLRNIWIGAGLRQSDNFLSDYLIDDLNKIPMFLRVSTKIGGLLIALEKEFALTVNYAKGHGNLFNAWMLKYHPGALLFPILRVTTGTRQDSGTKGAIIAYMNRQYYFQFLDEQLSSKTKDHSILQKSHT